MSDGSRILVGDVRDVLPTLAEASVHCVVTSPPYYGLRDYQTAQWDGGDPACDHQGEPMRTRAAINANCGTGVDRKNASARQFFRELCDRCGASRVDLQIGLEPTLDEYIAKMVAVFREVRRVLRDDGTLWLNMGHSYATGTSSRRNPTTTGKHGYWQNNEINLRVNGSESGLKPKDLIGVPWRVAFALQADGWYLRQDIIWHKPAPMPESVRDRCTKAHEYIFLLSKSPRYYFDADAIKETGVCPSVSSEEYDQILRDTSESWYSRVDVGVHSNGKKSDNDLLSGKCPPNGRNKRSIWTVASQPYPGAHFATFPPKLIEPCILAGTSAHGACAACGAPWQRMTQRRKSFQSGSGRSGRPPTGKQDLRGSATNSTPDIRMGPVVESVTLGWEPTCKCDAGRVPCVVLDPFLGSGTTAQVAMMHGREYIGIELSESYVALARNRLGLFAPGAEKREAVTA